MTTRGYKAYCERLKEYGYKYMPDKPYDGANSWVKWFVKDEKTKIFVSFQVFYKVDTETGEDVYTVNAHGQMEDAEACPHLISLYFGHHPDLAHIEKVMEEAKLLFE